MEHDTAGARDLADAVAIRAARRELDLAISDLAAAPLDQDTADRMQQVLDGPKLRRAREAFRRIAGTARSGGHLRAVEAAGPSAHGEGDEDDLAERAGVRIWDPVLRTGGAA